MINIDFFPSDFRLKIQNNKGKKTSIGGMLTLAIIGLGLGYFVYLIYAWLSHIMQASFQSYYSTLKMEQEADHPPFLFSLTRMTPEGIKPIDLTYYQVEIVSGESVLDQNQKQVELVDCKMYFPDYAGYICPNMSDPNFKMSVDLWSSIRVYYCLDAPTLYFGDEESPVCKSLEEQITLFYSAEVEFQVIYVSKQYDKETRELSYVYQTRRKIFDPMQFVVTLIQTKLAEINIDNGFLFQNTHTQYSFDEFQDNVVNLNKDTARARYDYFVDYCIFYFEFTIHPQMKSSTIQFPRFGQVLAEFNSIFSVILMLSIIGQFVSEKETLHLLRDTIRRSYYGEPQATPQASAGATVVPSDKNEEFSSTRESAKSHPTAPEKLDAMCTQYLNYETILEDLLRLKKAVSLLYEPEQWAMIERTGYALPETRAGVVKDQNNNSNIVSVAEMPPDVNHLQEVEKIDCDAHLRRQYQQKFMRQYDQNQRLNAKILRSVIAQRSATAGHNGEAHSGNASDQGLQLNQDIELQKFAAKGLLTAQQQERGQKHTQRDNETSGLRVVESTSKQKITDKKSNQLTDEQDISN